MKSKPLMMMIVAGGCGLVAMLGYQEMRAGQDKEQEETVPVLVAIADIPSGVRLDETNTQFKAYPKSEVPEEAVTSFEQYEKRAPIKKLATEDVILTSHLGDKGHFGASNKIPKGMRVVTIPVTDSMSHSGQLLPGDRVDVVLTFKQRHPDRGQITRTKPILQYIEVFSTDNNRDGTTEQTDKMAKNVSLLATPEQAVVVPLAKSMGELSLMLRTKGDNEIVESEPVDDSLLQELELLAPIDEKPEEFKGMTEDDVRRLLANERDKQKGQEEPAEPIAEPVAEEELWTVRIYEGDTVRIEEVPIDHELEKPADRDSASDDKDATPGWLSKAKKLWSEAKAAAPETANAG